MRLTVLSVAFPFAPVGPDAVGGAEQILSHLDRALVRAGHRSIVVACAGSVTAGALVAVPRAAGAITEAARRLARRRHGAAIERALRRWPVDLVHMHGLDFCEYLPSPGPPVVATLHLPPEWYPAAAFSPARPNTFVHCVSAAQSARCPPGALLLPAIPNGVPVEALTARHARRGFALALGRICPEKGFHHALDAARRAGVPLLLAGQVFGYGAHETYFRREIVPRLDRWRRFIGPIGFARKRRLLSAARCVLIPSSAEISPLVAMEALACGTPVVAFPAGTLPDMIDHGRTGFIVKDEREMADAIAATERLDADVCRAAARERFSLEKMTSLYLALYRALVGATRSPPPPAIADLARAVG
jgi:glycosyltransferase involved in cell wall biosynthesis